MPSGKVPVSTNLMAMVIKRAGLTVRIAFADGSNDDPVHMKQDHQPMRRSLKMTGLPRSILVNLWLIVPGPLAAAPEERPLIQPCSPITPCSNVTAPQ